MKKSAFIPTEWGLLPLSAYLFPAASLSEATELFVGCFSRSLIVSLFMAGRESGGRPGTR